MEAKQRSRYSAPIGNKKQMDKTKKSLSSTPTNKQSYGCEAKFKNSNGVYRLRDLFFEVAKYGCSKQHVRPSDRENIMYTLKMYDHEGYPSIHKLYVQEEDPGEYTFATKYFADWHHWELIRDSKWFQPYYERMKRELQAKLEARAVQIILEKAENGSKDALAAHKYLIDKGYIAEPKTKAPVGRPTKPKEPKQLPEDDRIQQDWERMQELMTDEPNEKQERPN